MKFIRNHKILVAIIVLLLAFAGFNLLRERGVKRVAQTNTPSVQEVQQALQNPALTTPNSTMPGSEPATNGLRTGTFVNGAKAYKGSGTARVVTVDGKPVLQLGDDFTTTSGPDLHVYLSPNADPKTQGLGDFVTLGTLQNRTGAQVYNLPDNHASYASVVIYCRAFTSIFTQASLQ